MDRKPCSTDLPDAEYRELEALLPAAKASGRSRLRPLREILNSIFYLVRGARAWRLLPHKFPPWQTVYHSLRLRRLDGTWERSHRLVRVRLREHVGHDPQPGAGIIESQSVKTANGGEERGDDGAKKLAGRKRHILVATQGLVLKAKVHTAAAQDRAAVPWFLQGARDEFPRLEHVWLDRGYSGGGKAWIEAHLGWTAGSVRHPPKPRGVWAAAGALIDWGAIRPKGFRGVLPRKA